MVMMCRENSSHIHHLLSSLYHFLRILLLKMVRVFADVKSGGNSRHNLGECAFYDPDISDHRWCMEF